MLQVKIRQSLVLYELGKSAHVARVCIEDTIDYQLVAMQEKKSRMINRALGEDGQIKTKLPLEEMCSPFGVGENADDFGLPDEEAFRDGAFASASSSDSGN